MAIIIYVASSNMFHLPSKYLTLVIVPDRLKYGKCKQFSVLC